MNILFWNECPLVLHIYIEMHNSLSFFWSKIEKLLIFTKNIRVCTMVFTSSSWNQPNVILKNGKINSNSRLSIPFFLELPLSCVSSPVILTYHKNCSWQYKSRVYTSSYSWASSNFALAFSHWWLRTGSFHRRSFSIALFHWLHYCELLFGFL